MYATVSDLEDRWRILTDAEKVPALTLLSSAERLVLSTVPDVPTRIASGTLDRLTVVDVVCEAVRRALSTRIFGAQQSTTSIGQVSQTVQYANPQSNLYLAKDEIARLSPAPVRRAFAVNLWPV